MNLRKRWLLGLLLGSLIGNSLLGMPVGLQAALTPEKVSPQVLVNLNKANAVELESIKGIGPMLAQRILQYRETNGRFERLEDLIHVPGIGQAKFERIKSQITL